MSESITNVQATNSDTSVKPPVEYAHFGYRLGAYLIDYFALQVIMSFVGLLAFLPFLPSFISLIEQASNATSQAEEEAVVFGMFGPLIGMVSVLLFVAVLTYWLYYALFDSSKFQGTPGKMALGIKVTDENGNKISFLRATGRHFAMYISGYTLYIGYLFPLWTEKKQTLHDIIAGCVVVKK